MFWSAIEHFTECKLAGYGDMACGKNGEHFGNNNGNNNKNNNKVNATNMFLLVLVVYVLILFVLAPWLWNNVLCKLVPAVKKSQWYDMFLLALLLAILLPSRM